MNFQCDQPTVPLKVLMVNSLSPAAQLLSVKILSGRVFGTNQRVHLILIVYSNEMPLADAFKLELEKCAYPCTQCITTTSDIPGVSDADVFCFITNFPNPNNLDFDNIETDEQFDTFYITLKIANNLKWVSTSKTEDSSVSKQKKSPKENILGKKKPIFIADGLAALDILYSFSKDMPSDVLHCPTPLLNVAKSILGDHLKVQRNVLNDTLVWAANDDVFHVEVEKPFILQDKPDEGTCDWEMIGKDLMGVMDLDHTQFNASWMKKEFIEKIKATASKNPYGCIYKASELAKVLSNIWMSRCNEDGDGAKVYDSLGVISDGSIGTRKGLPYVLPLILSGDTWTVNERFSETSHLKSELKRINAAVKNHHEKLMAYCKTFFKENIINQAFLRAEEDSMSEYSH